MEFRGIGPSVLIVGHYGSGKTNVAVNAAIAARLSDLRPVHLADLDIVNPYFRSADAADLLREHGVDPLLPQFANTNVDIPSLPPRLASLLDSKDDLTFIDVGGDDGSVALGMYRGALERAGYAMWFVVNAYRPLISTAEGARDCLREIEEASGLRCTGLVNNSNLGEETTAQEVLASVPYARACAEACSLPLLFHAYRADLIPDLPEAFRKAGLGDEPLFPMRQATRQLF